GEYGEPAQHGPQPILLAQVVRTGAKALLAAQRTQSRIQQIAKEFPPCRGLIAAQASRRGDAVDSRTGGHRAGYAGQPGTVARNALWSMLGNDRQGVTRGDETLPSQDQVAIAIAIAGGPEVRGIRRVQMRHQLSGMHQVGIRMAAAEIFER